jgi:hypothetical protein
MEGGAFCRQSLSVARRQPFHTPKSFRRRDLGLRLPLAQKEKPRSLSLTGLSPIQHDDDSGILGAVPRWSRGIRPIAPGLLPPHIGHSPILTGNRMEHRARRLRWPPHWCRKRPSSSISMPNAFDCLKYGPFISGGHFGQFSAGEQQRPDPCRSQLSTLAQDYEAVEKPDFKFVPSLDASLIPNAFRNDHLPFDGYFGDHLSKRSITLVRIKASCRAPAHLSLA